MSAAQILPFLQNLAKKQTVVPQFDNPAPAPPMLNAQAPSQDYDPSADVISQANSQPVQNPTLAPETKGHKLLKILFGGLQGGLAGRAAEEQAVAQSGGRESAGAGMGFQAAQALPFMLQERRNQLAQQQAQTEILRQQAQNINVPGYGSMPAGLAKVLFPSLIRGQATTQAAQIGATGRTQAAQIGGEARVKAAQLGLGPIADVPQDLQQQYGLPAQMPLKMLNMAESAANRPLTIVQGANDAYVVNKQNNTKQATGVGSGRLASTLARPVQVADPDNPGNTKYVSAGTAIQQGAAGPNSASVQVPKAAMRSELPTKLGDQKVAFNTALQHADLLEKALGAMNNGDVRTLNTLKNRFKTEFGSPDVTNFQAIANAYTREITKMLSAGHMTNEEISTNGATLPANASPQQILGALQSYRQLAASKLGQLNQQKAAAINQSQPKGKGNSADPLGIR